MEYREIGECQERGHWRIWWQELQAFASENEIYHKHILK
jgi:hypothetical protein